MINCKIMKTNIVLIIIIALLGTVANGQNSGEMNIPLSSPSQKGELYVNIKRGHIKVVGTNRQDVLINYEAMESNKDCDSCDDDKNEDGLKRIGSGAVDLEAYESDNKVRVNSDSWNKGLSLIIQVPLNFDLDLNGYNGGDIIVENITGQVSLQNYNGSITANGISGSVSANTYNGEIRVVLYKVTDGVPMAFNTYNGNVDVTFPPSMKGSFKMKTSRGEILSGFDMKVAKAEPVKKTDTKSGTYKVYLDDWVRGDINGGGVEIVMKTYNDDIYIRKK